MNSFFIRKIISDDTKYCCLCFQDDHTGFNLYDEIVLDTENIEDLYEILCTVLGSQVLESFSSSTVCQVCTKTVIKCYNFIKKCKDNVQKMASYINYLKRGVDNLTEDTTNSYQSLFLALNTDYTCSYIFDKKQISERYGKLLKRYQHLCRKAPQIETVYNYITLDIECESMHSDVFENDIETSEYSKQKNTSVELTDIALSPEKSEDNDYKCKNCLKAYPTILKLKLHYFRVHAPKDFKCSKCPRSFGTHLLLNKHNSNSHCTVVCSTCGKKYNNTYSLRHHEKSHNFRLVCQTCGKVYKGKQAFKKHIEQKLCEQMRKSNAEAKFTCNYCKKKYSQKTALSVHIRLEHEDGKALICDWCGKRLSSISRLRDHILTHTKQKDFECNICGGKFVTKTSLLYHTRTHTGEKPYKCDSCDMRFLSASRRSEHKKRHHMAPKLECDICHEKFKGQTSLRTHRKKHFDLSSRLYHNLPSQENKT